MQATNQYLKTLMAQFIENMYVSLSRDALMLCEDLHLIF